MFKLFALSFALLLSGVSAATSTAKHHGSLAHEARQVALHGGITGSCHGCSTSKMKELMRQVYSARFASEGPYIQGIAVCLMTSESGGNPGAISSTGDYGGLQANYIAHHTSHPEWYQAGRGFKYLIFDPWYGASEMWAMSSRGHSWSPWAATIGGCI